MTRTRNLSQAEQLDPVPRLHILQGLQSQHVFTGISPVLAMWWPWFNSIPPLKDYPFDAKGQSKSSLLMQGCARIQLVGRKIPRAWNALSLRRTYPFYFRVHFGAFATSRVMAVAALTQQHSWDLKRQSNISQYHHRYWSWESYGVYTDTYEM